MLGGVDYAGTWETESVQIKSDLSMGTSKAHHGGTEKSEFMLACLPCTYNSTMSHVDKTFLRVSVPPW